jgi:hypothetical protein
MGLSLNFNVWYDSHTNKLSITAYSKDKKDHVSFYFSDIVSSGEYLFDCGEYPDIAFEHDTLTLFDYCRTKYEKDHESDKNIFVLKNRNESSLHLTKLDTIKKIISGTFSVDLYNHKGEKMEITEGRFDAEY